MKILSVIPGIQDDHKMNQALYAHMNNKRKKINKKKLSQKKRETS
jgi:hypothetical protein